MIKFTSILFLIILMGCSNKDSKSDYEKKIIFNRLNFQASFIGVNSPLNEEEIKTFGNVVYFDVDSSFRVLATAKERIDKKPLRLNSDTAHSSIYYPFVDLYFKMNGVQSKLIGYVTDTLDVNSVFVPFTDETNNDLTYGGGRFLDVDFKVNQQLILDFNLAYNPYCAYSSRYICPKAPENNHIKSVVLVGEKVPLIENH